MDIDNNMVIAREKWEGKVKEGIGRTNCDGQRLDMGW